MNEHEELNHRAEALCREGRFEEARTVYEQAAALNPSSATAACNLAAVQFLLRNLPEASLLYTRALQLEPGLVEASLGMVRTRLAQHDWTGAADAADTMDAAQRVGREVEWRYLRGLASEGMGDRGAALAAFEGAAAAGYAPAQKALLRLLIRTGQHGRALDACFRFPARPQDRWTMVAACLTSCGNDWAVHDQAARAFLEARQYAYAARVAARAARTQPPPDLSACPALKECSWC